MAKQSRRTFIKRIGAMAAGSMLTATDLFAADTRRQLSADNGPKKIPTRPFGKTGVDVSILSLGGVLDQNDMIVFRQAFNMGVTYWDTADSYGWGKNEKAIGKYFSKFPSDREHIFLVTKTSSSDPEVLSEKLDTSLRRMNTTYVDMYFIHYVTDAKKELTPEVKAWAENAKAQGKIRYFGFSAHKNMEASMLEAARLGWIDGIMMTYNYRLMGEAKMSRAVDACAAAGIGLTAMKTQAAFTANFYAAIGSETDDALKMTDHFINDGFTVEQARLKAVWENPHIASICSAMPNMTVLQANIAAALNHKSLSRKHRRLLNEYAHRTSCGYCAGCAHICEPVIGFQVPISDIMRFSMYHNSYGEHERASALFRKLPETVKNTVRTIDYSEAEKHCPRKIAIGKVMCQAYDDLA